MIQFDEHIFSDGLKPLSIIIMMFVSQMFPLQNYIKFWTHPQKTRNDIPILTPSKLT